MGLNAGTSVKLIYQTMTQQDIENALSEVLLKPKYKKNAEIRSSLFQDQKDKPIERAVFWVEWLMRHPNDYKEIQLSRVHELGWFAASGYDILVFYGLVIFLIVKVSCKVFKKIFKGNSIDGQKKKKKE